MRYILYLLLAMHCAVLEKAQCPNVGLLSGPTTPQCVNTNINLSVGGTASQIEWWERRVNGGGWLNLSNAGQSIYSDFLGPNIGTYEYRVLFRCDVSPFNTQYTSIFTVTVGNTTPRAICNNTLAPVRGGVVKIVAAGSTFSGTLVNNTENDGKLYVLTAAGTSPTQCISSSQWANAVFTFNEDMNACSGGSATTTKSVTGASLVAQQNHIILLELSSAPDLPELTYMGWDLFIPFSVSSIFQSSDNNVRKGIATGGNPQFNATFVRLECNGTITPGNNVGAVLAKRIPSWSNGSMSGTSRGAPILTDNKKMVGVYLGGTQSNCSNGEAYFMPLSELPGILSFLRSGNQSNSATVSMNYCKPSENLFGNLNEDKPYQVTGSIVSTQNIGNGYVVRYKAGSFIELNPGFVSGTDFIAEIDPCVISMTIIAAKTDDIDETHDYYETISINENTQIKIYPSVLPSGHSINIVTSATLNNVTVVVYDLNSKPITSKRIAELNANTPNQLELPALSSGFYIVNVYNNGIFFTQKIIIQ